MLDTGRLRPRRAHTEETRPAQFISTESLSPDELVAMWNDIVLTESEDRVLTALRFIEGRIERVAAVVARQPYYFYPSGGRGGFKVKLRDAPAIPIGSLGDGIWRMMAMAIALVRSKGGTLLVDEIDTGLHYTVQADMWRLIIKRPESSTFRCLQQLTVMIAFTVLQRYVRVRVRATSPYNA